MSWRCLGILLHCLNLSLTKRQETCGWHIRNETPNVSDSKREMPHWHDFDWFFTNDHKCISNLDNRQLQLIVPDLLHCWHVLHVSHHLHILRALSRKKQRHLGGQRLEPQKHTGRPSNNNNNNNNNDNNQLNKRGSLNNVNLINSVLTFSQGLNHETVC